MPEKTIALSSCSVYPKFLAEDAKRVRRETLGDNKTSSVAEENFDHYRYEELSPEKQKDLLNPAFLLQQSRASIEQHVEKRFSLLFTQAVVCYKTKHEFKEGHTCHQGLNATTLQAKTEYEVEFQAAHSGTLPNLHASSKGGAEVVYLYRSGFYDESQATIDVIKAVNDADRAIDEKYNTSLLRTKTVKLLNKASTGELTPQEVAQQFIHDFIDEVNTALKREKSEQVRAVLRLYRQKAHTLIDYIQQPEAFDRWLNLDMEDPLLAELTGRLDQAEKEGESDREALMLLISKKISDLSAEILQERHQVRNESVPFHFTDLYHIEVLKQFKYEDLAVVEEALGVELDTLSQKEREKIGAASKELQHNAEKIDHLAQSLLPLIAKAQGEEVPEMELEGASEGKKNALRPHIYKLRYRIILRDQQVQSTIKSKYESVLNALKKQTKGHHLELFFQDYFLQQLNEEKQLQACRLFNISRHEVRQHVREIKVNEKIFSTLDLWAREISQVAHTLKLARTEAEKKQAQLGLANLYDLLSSASGANAAQMKALVQRRLFDSCETPKQIRKFEQLIGIKVAELDQKIETYLAKKSLTEAQKTIERNRTSIEKVATVFCKHTAALAESTARYQRELLVALRKSHGMNGKAFSSRFKQINPTATMNPTKLSHLERGNVAFTPQLLEQIATLFGVSTQLFYPDNFAC